MAFFGSSWFEGEDNEDIGPLSHWKEDFSYGDQDTTEDVEKQKKICNECGRYYKNGCPYWPNNLSKCNTQIENGTIRFQ